MIRKIHKRNFIFVYLSMSIISFLGYISADADTNNKQVAVNQVKELLNSAGIPSSDVRFAHQWRKEGDAYSSVIANRFNVSYEEAEWTVDVDNKTCRIIGIQGNASFVQNGQAESIDTYEEASSMADVWFSRLNPAKNRKWKTDIELKERNRRNTWIIRKWPLIQSDLILRSCSTVEIDSATGGLVSFQSDPDFSVPIDMPKCLISREQAIKSAAEKIASSKTEHYEASQDVHLIDDIRLLTWRLDSKGHRQPAIMWRLQFAGHAKKISYLPPEYQKMKPAEIESVLWHVLVDCETGAVDIHWIERQNKVFMNGKIQNW